MTCLFLNGFVGSILRHKSLIYVLAIGTTLFMCGCSYLKNGRDNVTRDGFVVPFEGKEGVKHFVIIGFGIVSVKCPESETAALATSAQALGINVSDQPALKFGAGYSSSTVLSVPNATRAEDVRIEVSKHPLGLLKVTSHSAKLKNDSSNKGGGNDGEEE